MNKWLRFIVSALVVLTFVCLFWRMHTLENRIERLPMVDAGVDSLYRWAERAATDIQDRFDSVESVIRAKHRDVGPLHGGVPAQPMCGTPYTLPCP
jgi:hypothetical protein